MDVTGPAGLLASREHSLDRRMSLTGRCFRLAPL